jgi:endogenous inhibitor of DNA gyrase (YacG/DUF329 family)
MGTQAATWSISLDSECPSCKEDVDLLDGGDFWDGRLLQPLENGTPRSRNVEVVCPKCGHEFEVNLEF